MIIASWNVNSVMARMAHLLAWLQEVQPTILCLQETKTVDEKFPRQPFEEMGYQVECYGEKTYNGVAILSRLPLTDVRRGFDVEIAAGSRRLISAKAFGVDIINVYIPNGSAVGSDKYRYKLEWMQSLRKHIKQHHEESDKVLLCGDFNIAPEDRDVYNPADVAETIMCSSEERAHLEAIRDFGFVDVFRRHCSEPGQFTWWDYRMGAFRRNMGFRIDHIWATAALAEHSVSCRIDKKIRKAERPSDHAPVVAQFDIDT